MVPETGLNGLVDFFILAGLFTSCMSFETFIKSIKVISYFITGGWFFLSLIKDFSMFFSVAGLEFLIFAEIGYIFGFGIGFGFAFEL